MVHSKAGTKKMNGKFKNRDKKISNTSFHSGGAESPITTGSITERIKNLYVWVRNLLANESGNSVASFDFEWDVAVVKHDDAYIPPVVVVNHSSTNTDKPDLGAIQP